MVSFDVRRALKTTGGVLALLSIALPSTTFSQRGAQQQIAASLEDEIRAVETRDGPNSASLIDPLTALGLAYRESGEPFLAAAALRQAVQVIRFNYGLHALEQVPLMRQMIANAESVGDYRRAWDLEQGLLNLAARHPDDVRTAQIFRDTADRRMNLLVRYNAGESPPEIVLGCYYEGPHVVQDAADVSHEKNCTAGTSHRVREGLVIEAQAYYERAVSIILRNQRYSSDELPPLLMDLVQSSYQYGNPSLGRRSLSYLLAYEASNSDAWLTRVDTLVQIADWDLLHAVGRDDEESALAEYAQAYQSLERQGIAQESIDQMFSPATPVILPAFFPNPLVTDATPGSAGYVDVAFDIDRFGRGRHVRIVDTSRVLETSDNATRLVEKRLVQLIARGRFRPRFADGRVTDGAPIVVRYYFNVFDRAESRWSLYWAPADAVQRRDLVGWRSPNE